MHLKVPASTVKLFLLVLFRCYVSKKTICGWSRKFLDQIPDVQQKGRPATVVIRHTDEKKIKIAGKEAWWWNRGRLEHFNKPANGWYVWVVDENGDFVVGDRSTSESVKYGHKLPHPVLANEKKVYGAGEVLIKDGLIKEYNSGTGHYFDRRDPRGFDKQSKEVFEYFRKTLGRRLVGRNLVVARNIAKNTMLTWIQ